MPYVSSHSRAKALWHVTQESESVSVVVDWVVVGVGASLAETRDCEPEDKQVKEILLSFKEFEVMDRA